VTEEHVQQMHHLLPDAHTFRATTHVQAGRRLATFAIGLAAGPADGPLGHAALADRREAFHRALVAHVAAAHTQFLAALGVALPEGAKLRCWHPRFDPESVPDVPTRPLFPAAAHEEHPSPPGTPAQVLDAIDGAARARPSGTPAAAPPTPPVAAPPATKKPSLLDRIKARERQATTELMLAQDPPAAKATARASDLAVLTDFCHALAFLFASANKGALPLGDITTKLTTATGKGGGGVALAPAEIAQRLERLGKLVPDWLTILPTGRAVIVKIDRATPIRDVLARLAENLQK
jgi:hypothetical protein